MATDVMDREKRTAIVKQINDIIEENCHKCPYRSTPDYMEVCVGCPILDKLQTLGKTLTDSNDESKKINQILSKGENMTTSEMMYLLEIGVPKKQIRKAVGTKELAFNSLLLNLQKGSNKEVVG
jgi:hypothetical protein